MPVTGFCRPRKTAAAAGVRAIVIRCTQRGCLAKPVLEAPPPSGDMRNRKYSRRRSSAKNVTSGEKCVRSAQKLQVGPWIPVGIQPATNG